MLQGLNKHAVVKEGLNWMLLVFLVALLSALLFRVAGGAMPPVDAPPGTLPPMEEWATPITPRAETLQEPAPPTPSDFDFGVVTKLWATMQLHRDGDVEEAIAGWEAMNLPCESEVWRNVALAAAHLRVGNVDEAADLLDYSEQMDGNNPLVHYYKALLRLTQAVTAPEWFDAIENRHTVLVSHSPNTTAPLNTLYRLAAIQEFEKVIELAAKVDLTQRLVPDVMLANHCGEDPIGSGLKNAMLVSNRTDPMYRPLYVLPVRLDSPTVGDLLLAIGADNFEGKAHNMLGPLHLERGSLGQAEDHMDAATKFGLNVLDGYSELGKAYKARGDHDGAFRVYLKDMANGGGIVGPARKALESLRDSLFN